ncbi:alpha-(1-_3)-arabinofuranosyltransferase family protein [Blastococcus sp. TF02A-30]|uniref:alpha-(1->3)-arabinofuranosyltransferase domain-containing protein n=1 Tax=Blastococcus sp. TF02A-30 TaxID=2250580 RepID=UPI001313FFE0|nr:alpha-(1->3)-arabinofuranosyltransferase family protein [Blastococcus sp. TF02A-30]
MLQQPGRTTFDTKFDLTIDPGGFLDRALHMWIPTSLGQLQNQAYGYLFPQGPFFLGADLLHVPPWVAQRLWSALLLVAAYEGVRRIALALGLPGPAALLGGLCYALAPRLLGAVGVISGEVLPTAVLPWVVLPVVLAVARRLTPRRAGLLSGVAVLFMSGVNAAGTIAALPIAFFVAASRFRERGGRSLLGWWALGTALACAWWIGPLLLLGRYSPPFLDFIETAAATTSPTGWANSLRGADHWVAYHTVGGQGWWPGAHALVTSDVVAVLGPGVAALALVGLVHPRMPLRGPLATSLAVGLLCLTVGHPSAVGSFVDGPVRALLDGPLAPLRNVHKVDPLVRLPLALGLAHGTVLAARWARALLQRRGLAVHQPAALRVLVGALVAALLVSSSPLLTNGLRMPGWTQVPGAWTSAAGYLEERPGSRALVVPGAGFGVQTWGWTVDEPLQGLTDGSWATRSQVPMVPGATARLLDAVESRLANGQGGPGLAQTLARMGVTHVVLRRDLDRQLTDTGGPDRMERALRDSPGVRRVAGYGSTGYADQKLVEVFAVEGAQRVSVVDADDLVTLDGGPEDVLTAADAGLLSPGQAALVGTPEQPADVVADGQRLVERQFGRIHDATSEVMTASAPSREDRPATDYAGAPTRTAVADYLSLDGITASSSQGYTDVFGPVLPAHGPAAAFDGRPETSWRSASLARAPGQWLDLDLAEPVTGGVLAVTFASGAGTAEIREAAVAFGGASNVYGVPSSGRLLVTLPEEPVERVRITVVSVAPGLEENSPVAISEVELPGLPPGRTLDVPRRIGAGTSVVLRAAEPRRACVDVGYGPHCETSEIRTGEWGGLDRRLTVAEGGAWELSGTVVAQPGDAAAALLGPLGDGAVVTASSVLGGDPSVSGAFAFDDQEVTSWLADPAADEVTLRVSWTGERTITRLTTVAPAVPAADPVRARVESSSGVREVDLTDALGFFEPLPAVDGVTLTFTRSSVDAGLPIGLAEVGLTGAEDLRHRPWAESPTGAVCGLGPQVVVDGTAHATEVTGTLGDILTGTPLAWRVCDGPVQLASGTHRVVAQGTLQFQPLSLVWSPVRSAASGAGADGRGGDVDVGAWTATRRVLSVSAERDTVLRIAENVNDGWRATLDGAELEPVVLDGWAQGYRLPAGTSGDVVVEYTPDRAYRLSLMVGLLLAGALVLLAADSARPRYSGRGLLAGSLRSPRRGLRPVAAAGAGALALVMGGIPFAAGWVAGLLPPVRRHAALVGAAAVAATGVLVALSPGTAGGRPGVWADTAAALGLGLLLSRLVRVQPQSAHERARGEG